MGPSKARQLGWRWALVGSLLLHALLYLGFRHMRERERLRAPRATTIDIALEPSVLKAPKPSSSAAPLTPRAPKPAREARPRAETGGAEASPDEMVVPSPAEAPLADAPRRLDLALHQRLVPASESGATRTKLSDDVPEAALPSVAGERIAAWIRNDDARRRRRPRPSPRR